MNLFALLRDWRFKVAVAGLFCLVCMVVILSQSEAGDNDNIQARAVREIIHSLAGRDPAFGRLKVVPGLSPKAQVVGTLDTPAQLDSLETEIARQFGAERAKRFVSQVKVSGGPAAAAPAIPRAPGSAR